jgi:D-alanyl-lipoteichoic acid acyltransferase DltB (MBOAT superfamily)
MSFISVAFLVLYLITIAYYYLLHRNYKLQNILLLIASYTFYASWDWRFLGLLILSSAVNYVIGRTIYGEEVPGKRKTWLALALVYNLAILGSFKYFNFFEDNLINLVGLWGIKLDAITLKIILPLGLSYYTFQSLSYPLDIYRKKIQPTSNIINFALFTSFFATIISGPIERASHLLPQIEAPRSIDLSKINSGLFLIFWGCFEKLVIANNAGLIADHVFNNYAQYQGLDLVAGILAFTIQIYCDFSGYTDMARGIGKLLGFDLLLNFHAPYFSRNPSDFWGHWHISLSSWFRDYLYIPLGGNKKGRFRTYFNLVFTMALCGLWHGAAWNYAIWGIYHGVLLCIYRVYDIGKQSSEGASRRISPFVFIAQIVLMFILVSVGWALFRATSANEIVYIFSNLGFAISTKTGSFYQSIAALGLLTALANFLQLKDYGYPFIMNLNPWLRGIIYAVVIVIILIFTPRETVHFIYQSF